MRLRVALAITVALGSFGRVAAAQRKGRVAVLPIAAAATPAAECRRWQDALEKSIPAQLRVMVLGGDAVERELKKHCGARSRWWSCYEDDQALVALGRSAGVDLVIAGKLAAMGGAYAIKLRYVDVAAEAGGTKTLEAVTRDSLRLPAAVVAELKTSVPSRAGQAAVARVSGDGPQSAGADKQRAGADKQRAGAATRRSGAATRRSGAATRRSGASRAGDEGLSKRLGRRPPRPARSSPWLVKRWPLWVGVGAAAVSAFAVGVAMVYRSASDASKWQQGDARVRLP